MLDLYYFKLYRWWKGGIWTCMTFPDCPFMYWTRQPNLYNDVIVISREIYNHQRDIWGESFE